MTVYDAPPKNLGFDEYEIIIDGKVGRAKDDLSNVIIPPLYESVESRRVMGPRNSDRFFVCEKNQTYTVFNYLGFLIFENIPYGAAPKGYEEEYEPADTESIALNKRLDVSSRCLQLIVTKENHAIRENIFGYTDLYDQTLEVLVGKLPLKRAELVLSNIDVSNLWNAFVELIVSVKSDEAILPEGTLGRIGYGKQAPYNMRGMFNFYDELPVYITSAAGDSIIIGVSMKHLRLLRDDELEFHAGRWRKV